MKHNIVIKHFGPIGDCELDINDFTVLTGPQSNGKSTIAKAIYYFRTVKQDILSIMLQGGPRSLSGEKNAEWNHTLRQRLRTKFLELFGTSWIMPLDMSLKYTYSQDCYIRVFLQEDNVDYSKNYIRFDFSPALQDYLNNLDQQLFINITPGQRVHEESVLNKLFNDPYETIFIPAGRNLITLLSTQLNYIFTSLEDSQLRSIDYITKRYTELILRIKPLFTNGYAGMESEVANRPEMASSYKDKKPALNYLKKHSQDILRGKYRYVDGEERLYLDEQKYVKINFLSSGQQEIVWVFNLLFYYLLENKRIALILEEPESHLFPDSQQEVGEILAMFHNEKNQVLVTTHSPYLLGTFNYLLLSGQAPSGATELIKAQVRKRLWLYPEKTSAFYVIDGNANNAVLTEDGISLIQNELIDGASTRINEKSDFVLEKSLAAEGNDEH